MMNIAVDYGGKRQALKRKSALPLGNIHSKTTMIASFIIYFALRVKSGRATASAVWKMLCVPYHKRFEQYGRRLNAFRRAWGEAVVRNRA